MKKMYVQEIIDFVEENITEELCIEDISKHIGYSRFYLNKLFSIFTGMSIMFYVRKRKLEYILVELNTDQDIIDIAFKYGFNSRRAFTRMFSSFYGASPSNFRNKFHDLTPKIVLENIGGIKMLPYLSEPFEKRIDTLYVLTRRVLSKNPEEEVIGLQTKFKEEHNLTTLLEVGFDIPVSEDQEKQGIRGYEFWLCISKEDFDSIEIDIPKKLIIPSSVYICLTINDPFSNPFERIPNGWKKLSAISMEKYTFNNLALNCGLEHVEEIDGKTVMHIYIPIKK